MLFSALALFSLWYKMTWSRETGRAFIARTVAIQETFDCAYEMLSDFPSPLHSSHDGGAICSLKTCFRMTTSHVLPGTGYQREDILSWSPDVGTEVYGE